MFEQNPASRNQSTTQTFIPEYDVASLRIQLIAFWVLLLGVCAGLGIVMLVLYQNSAGVQIGQARAVTRQVCDAIAQRYQKSLGRDAASNSNEGLMQVVLQLALIEAPHVEGGTWSSTAGFLAYAYPTYEGGGIKHDVPEAERPHIAEVATAAAQSRSPQTDVLHGSREALVLSACPLSVAADGLAAWTMTRVPGEAEAALRNLLTGLAVLLVVVVISGFWLGTILVKGYRHVRQLEAALGAVEDLLNPIPELKRTGIEEFDRIIRAINQYSGRLAAAQQQARELLRQKSHDQRLTALGRMTGGIAHEIRNPIATMRLKAENALASSAGTSTDVLQLILQQIDRLDHLVQNLLALVQPLTLKLQVVDIKAWLDDRHAQTIAHAAMRAVALEMTAKIDAAYFDPLHVGRAVDNLLENAIRHAQRSGQVRLSIQRPDSGSLQFSVIDDGPGVAAEMRDHLFEPFATGRAEGTGLGLALVREVALAHGGEIRYVPRTMGACFEMELPWRTC